MAKKTNQTYDPITDNEPFEDEGKIIDLELDMPELRVRFCEEFVIDLNRTQAAIRAGYSPESAHVTGCRLLKDAKVAAYIKYLRTNLSEATGVTQNRIIRELQRIAFSDMGRFKSNWMTMAEFESLTEADRAAIASVDYQIRDIVIDGKSCGEETIVKFKLHDKLKATEMLNRMLGYNSADKIEVSQSLSPEEREAEIAALLGKLRK